MKLRFQNFGLTDTLENGIYKGEYESRTIVDIERQESKGVK